MAAPKSLAGKAISYTLNEYVRLVRYLKYDYISPDNNATLFSGIYNPQDFLKPHSSVYVSEIYRINPED